MKISLHTHTKRSHDGSLTEDSMRKAYGPGWVTAVTDHDEWSNPVADTRLPGIEHTIDAERYLHVVEVEFPGGPFRFLAHPKRPFPTNTRTNAKRVIKKYDLDGVEKFNAGVKQYEGEIRDAVELANDDAHNDWQTGTSYMVVESGDVEDAIRRGQFKTVNSPRPVSATLGKVRQGLQMGVARFRDKSI